MKTYTKTNLLTLRELGYAPVNRDLELSAISERIVVNTQRELRDDKKYLEFSEGELNGYIWYNSFLERWFCDIYKGPAYLETFLATEMDKIVKSVQAIYSGERPAA